MNARLLILSDGKPGHLNQSLAFAHYLGRAGAVVPVRFRNRASKLLSYLFDRCHLYLPGLLQLPPVTGDCCAIVCAGSETYYAGKLLARRLRLPVVAIMLPRGYRYDFALIVAQEHDRPPELKNILTLPVNLSRVEGKGVFRTESGVRYVGIIVGGPNKVFTLDPVAFGALLDRIFALFPQHRLVVTTSRRTTAAIEGEIARRPFAASFIYSRDPANPIPDFIALCDHLFITADSTSMISEAVTCGRAKVEIIPLQPIAPVGKYGRLVDSLVAMGAVHRFDGTLGSADRKIDLAQRLKGVLPCG
ncbi:MAG: hypothetical protein A2091_02605 [Desulfuromonadales bacterium GWD2_61_12]|nr:MAG: hypothetical protein A2005_03900 [Desulfuromonadales bacterium GWC2_61_20]OGR35396.1 MAG: hypothetical protein A2091_02605 [Desulfuromonadales bacterium GWD2_61_12]HAD03653.1 hypothetical protein [Desulfuromonas sp.]HBT83906.1 hypothetical protein [Desulfuromonas sp.]